MIKISLKSQECERFFLTCFWKFRPDLVVIMLEHLPKVVLGYINKADLKSECEK